MQSTWCSVNCPLPALWTLARDFKCVSKSAGPQVFPAGAPGLCRPPANMELRFKAVTARRRETHPLASGPNAFCRLDGLAVRREEQEAVEKGIAFGGQQRVIRQMCRCRCRGRGRRGGAGREKDGDAIIGRSALQLRGRAPRRSRR